MRFGGVASALTAAVVVAVAGGVTYAVAEIGGGEPIATTRPERSRACSPGEAECAQHEQTESGKES